MHYHSPPSWHSVPAQPRCKVTRCCLPLNLASAHSTQTFTGPREGRLAPRTLFMERVPHTLKMDLSPWGKQQSLCTRHTPVLLRPSWKESDEGLGTCVLRTLPLLSRNVLETIHIHSLPFFEKTEKQRETFVHLGSALLGLV